MTPRTCRIDLFCPALTALVLLSACRTDLAAPDAIQRSARQARESAATSASASGAHANRRKTFHGPRHTFVLDVDSGTLRDESGRVARLARRHVDLMARTFDGLAAAQRVANRLTKNARYIRTIERYGNSNRRVRASLGKRPLASLGNVASNRLAPMGAPLEASRAALLGSASATSSASGTSRRPRPTTLQRDYYSGGDYCTEIELAIYEKTQELDKVTAFTEELFAFAGGIKVNPEELFVYNLDGAFVTFEAALLQASQRAWTLRTTLDVLATFYDLYGCWNQFYPWTEPGTGGGDSGETDSGGTAEAQSCHEEAITLEISYDGGDTWETFWSGSATVCEYAT